MAILRIENFRNNAWMLRGEGPIQAETTMDDIKSSTDRSALNYATRALVDGAVVYETVKLTKARAKALFDF